MSHIAALRTTLQRLQNEVDELEQIIFLLEREDQHRSKKTNKRVTTETGLTFNVSSETIPAVIPTKEFEETKNDFDIEQIPNRNTGILDF